jgi:hypothetical protein
MPSEGLDWLMLGTEYSSVTSRSQIEINNSVSGTRQFSGKKKIQF